MSDYTTDHNGDRSETLIVKPKPDVTGSQKPVVEGKQFRYLKNRLEKDAQKKKHPPFNTTRLLDETRFILNKCMEHEETGLVVGHVQSGKTTSIAAVVALARDNDFKLVVVITGISTILHTQNTDRIQEMLGSAESRVFCFFNNPEDKPGSSDQADEIRDVLNEWGDRHVPPKARKIVVITVMKHTTHLKNVTAILNSLLASSDLKKVPALIIDDEVDQAGMNTKLHEDDESVTYTRLLNLRNTLPHHTYLGYTATPQAPLLIELVDTLAPGFSKVLEPGEGYVGSSTFFNTGDSFAEHRIKTIAEEELPTEYASVRPPPSLVAAIYNFVLGVAAGTIARLVLEDENEPRNRSMIVHPAINTEIHNNYFIWCKKVISNLRGDLERDDDDPVKQKRLAGLQKVYETLKSTVTQIPTFQKLVDMIPYAIGKQNLNIMEVNAVEGRTPEPKWDPYYAHILIGGQALSRGFTVEGLTVSYMPRGVGGRQVDTILQRARFLGYHKKYLGYCRVYLEEATQATCNDIVKHEYHLRNSLREWEQTGKSLKEWSRELFLAPHLKPCRDSVVGLPYVTQMKSGSWFWPRIPYAIGADGEKEKLTRNKDHVQKFLDMLEPSWEPNNGYPTSYTNRATGACHQIAKNVPYVTVLSSLLLGYELSGKDYQEYSNLLFSITHYLRDKDPKKEMCTVFLMSPDDDDSYREIDEGSNKIKALHAGPRAKESGGRKAYPGDAELKEVTKLTIQIYWLDLKLDKKIVAKEVPVLAVYLPKVAG